MVDITWFGSVAVDRSSQSAAAVLVFLLSVCMLYKTCCIHVFPLHPSTKYVCVYIQINKYIPNICNITHGPPENTRYIHIYKHNDDVEVQVMLTYSSLIGDGVG